MSTRSVVFIVILTFNHWEDTRACLASLYASDARTASIIVVDNDSADETPEALGREFPQALLIRNPSNLGYAEGNNVGLRYAIAHDAEFCVVLNNDVVVAPIWLEPLLEAAKQDSRAGFLGPMVYHGDAPEIIQSAGGILPGDWHAYHRGANAPNTGQFHVDSVDWLTGCAILARTTALREIGLLDAAFYMYAEDVDWCIRAHKAGYHVLFVPQSHVWHKGVQIQYSPAPYVTYYSARNELQLIRKHHAGAVILGRALARHLRTLASWSVRRRWQNQKEHRAALARALRDFSRGATGQISLV